MKQSRSSDPNKESDPRRIEIKKTTMPTYRKEDTLSLISPLGKTMILFIYHSFFIERKNFKRTIDQNPVTDEF